MAFEPKTPTPIRVPETLWRDLLFAFPAEPPTTAGLLGAGVLGYFGTPMRWAAPASGNVPRPSGDFSVSAVLPFPTGPGAAGFYVLGTDLRATGRDGFVLFVDSGKVRYDEVSSNGGATTTATCSANTAAARLTACVTRAASAATAIRLYLNGAQAATAATVGSWTSPSTLNIGWNGATTTGNYSGSPTDLYIFSRVLTAGEVARLHDGFHVP